MQHDDLKQSTHPATAVTRRTFLAQTATALAAAPLATAIPARAAERSANNFLDLMRYPDFLTAYSVLTDPLPLTRTGSEWAGSGIVVETAQTATLAITLSAPQTPVERLHLRWRTPVPTHLLVLGDAWERSYGDLCWRNLIPERVLPWYFATFDPDATHTYGVKTQPGALCFWQLDSDGVSLWLDVRNGGSGVQLGPRRLLAATVTTRQGQAHEDPLTALHAFCRQMCSAPSLPAPPMYGFNDWYYAYGKNNAQQILADTDLLATLSAGNAIRPFSVIDDGWQNRQTFPDMASLAAEIKARDVRTGLWIRPLQAPSGAEHALLLPDVRYGDRHDRFPELAYDPTIPEARERILAKVTQAVGWGYELVKHDFSTYELLGQWGFEMGASPTLPGWSLHDRTRTNAEVIIDLYRGIRAHCAAGTLVLGCNALGHLGQGLFDAQRTGDDTSGKQWERTRRMGVNTLAFRLPQHAAFFIQDADCVGLAPGMPWEKNRQWLDILARSGTALFVSPGKGARRPKQSAAIKAAFAIAAAGGSGARPADWLTQSTPEQWTEAGAPLHYSWCDPDGASPFAV